LSLVIKSYELLIWERKQRTALCHGGTWQWLTSQISIWSIEVAEAFGPRAEVVAFDISDRFTPPAPWLPPNLSIRIHDITLPFSEDLLGQFDVINFRLFLTLPPEKLNVMLANAMALLSMYSSSLYAVTAHLI
jgi:hypothetical protein